MMTLNDLFAADFFFLAGLIWLVYILFALTETASKIVDGVCSFNQSRGIFPPDKAAFLKVLRIKHIILIIGLFFTAKIFSCRQAQALAFSRWKANWSQSRGGALFSEVETGFGEVGIWWFKAVQIIEASQWFAVKVEQSLSLYYFRALDIFHAAGVKKDK